MDWYQDRNAKIYREWLGGAAKRDIAARWNVTPNWIDEIIKKMKAAEDKKRGNQ